MRIYFRPNAPYLDARNTFSDNLLAVIKHHKVLYTTKGRIGIYLIRNIHVIRHEGSFKNYDWVNKFSNLVLKLSRKF